MKKCWSGMLGLAGAGALLLAGQSTTNAGDHMDSPVVQAQPKADIYDLYAWMQDENTLNLVLTIPSGGFGDDVQYVFHVDSAPDYGAPPTTTRILCTFDGEQIASCWVGDQAYVQGGASDPQNPLTSADGKLRVFTGQRNDPFFFNMDGLMSAMEQMRAFLATYEGTFQDGCPQIDQERANTWRSSLAQDAEGDSVVTDDFAGQNVTALVIQVDKELVTAGGDLLGIWASTNAPSVSN